MAAKPKTQYARDIERMAQLLNVSSGDLTYLHALSSAERIQLYDQVQGAVSGEQSPLWPALAKSVRFFPARMSAKITQEALGPYIAAQMTRHLDSKTAIGIGKHFSTPFLADVFMHVDTTEVGGLLAKWPMSNLKKAVLYLFAEQQFEQLGHLVEHLPKDRVLALLKEIDSPTAIMQIADKVAHKSRMADAIIQLKDDQLFSLIEATSELGLWEAALLMCTHLNYRQQRRIATLAKEYEWDDERIFSEYADSLGITEQLAALFGQAEEPEGAGAFSKWFPAKRFGRKR